MIVGYQLLVIHFRLGEVIYPFAKMSDTIKETPEDRFKYRGI